MEPYRQGSLDGCCGIYSIINATKLVIEPFTYYDAAWTFQQCFETLKSWKDTKRAICYGTGVYDLLFLLKTVVQPFYPVVYRRPFAKAAKTHINDFWEACNLFLSEPKRSIIVMMQNQEWMHWTVLCKATEKRFFMFDSTGGKILDRRKCTTLKFTDDFPVALFPSVTIFVSA